MKNYFAIFIAFIILLSISSSCKTSEKNYKEAYDIAAAKHRGGVDESVSNLIKKEQEAPTATINGDSVKLVCEHVNIVDGKYSDVKPYNVIVAEFKQVFNARSMRDRINANQKGNLSYVIYNSKKLYMVVAAGFPNGELAADYLKNAERNIKMPIPSEKPWILKLP